jgi:hypothetical protein
MIAPLSFLFSIHDPSFTSKLNIISAECPYIAHAFVQTPIYDEATGNQIGYKVSDDYVQQVGPHLYIVRLSNTYFFTDRGSISWSYVFENNTNSYYYPSDVQVYSNIISGTGEFYGSSGTVRLFPTSDGTRTVQIIFNI